ncbi:Calcium-dependent protein kinase 34 [Hibiscus syriacus]|uniref:non-specific serine/threonine protein kinase n=1 Tax=Hibiscus syriacus TaxID=106335 RepID=A0A6A2ZPI1_HIBSY|nr:Calcium-dependent protein kinase 34 [Hibiscus syriacus]
MASIIHVLRYGLSICLESTLFPRHKWGVVALVVDSNEQEASIKNDNIDSSGSSCQDSFSNTPPEQQDAPSQESPRGLSGSSSKRNRPSIGTVLCRPMEDVQTIYYIDKELGRGQFGVTYLCTHKPTGEQFACKTIAKRNLVKKEDIEDVRREVQIMDHLTGQANIVELKGAYEDKHSVHLVMELCAGGELFDRIIARGHYTERAAASLLRTIVQIVHTCHSMGVFHRDLKPENFLLLNQEENSPLKATDFGLSVFYKPGDIFRDVVGSAYYIAPEVLDRKYGPEADIWSIGVMLYILLSGVPPFWGENENAIFSAILCGDVDFTIDPWPYISHQAKDLVLKMLNLDPKQRLTAQQVPNHPWIKEDGEAPDTPLDNAVLGRLKQFKAMNNFKKVALRVIAGCLSEEEIQGLKEMFKGMDTDNSGTITLEELKQGLAKQGTKLSEFEAKQLIEAADADGNGTIDYEEFITATMHMNRMDREEHLYRAFQHFDKDNSRYITIKELEQGLRDYGRHDDKAIKEIILEVDSDNVIHTCIHIHLFVHTHMHTHKFNKFLCYRMER